MSHYESPTRLVTCLDCSICSFSDRMVDVQYTCPPYSTAEKQCDRLVTPIVDDQTCATSTDIPTAGPTLQPTTHRPTPLPMQVAPTQAPIVAYDYVTTTTPTTPVMTRQPTVNFPGTTTSSGTRAGMTPYRVGLTSFSTIQAACLVLWIICFM